MGHDHHHDELQHYLTEQIATLAICGAMGAVSIALYANSLLFFIHPSFWPWVLAGGVALLLLVVIRAVAVWQFVGQAAPHEHLHAHLGHEHHDLHSKAPVQAPATLGLNLVSSPAVTATPPHAHHHHDHEGCDHDHDHDHDHGHAHVSVPAHTHDHSHDHAHDHDHGWAPWRYVLLLLPIALFFFNMPNRSFAKGFVNKVNTSDLDLEKSNLAFAGNEIDPNLTFRDLSRIAWTPESRAENAGKLVRLTGQYSALDNSQSQFTLYRYLMNCCAADAVPLNAIIVIDPSKVSDSKLARLDPKELKRKWVQVTGRIAFMNRRGTNNYITAIIVTPTEEKPLESWIQIVEPDADPYLF